MIADASNRAVRVRIEGRVQGVWFRGWTVDTATALGLDGWVRNRRDGTVEALISGPADAVAQMVDHCHRGPGAARVTAVAVAPAVAPATSGFTQKPTA